EVEEVFLRQQTVDALLTFSWNDATDPGHFGFKLAETLASSRPVVVVGPRDESLHEALAAGTRVLLATTPAEGTTKLKALAEEKRRYGAVRAEINEPAIRELGWDRIAERLLTELDRLLPIHS